ncbi:pentapeptide repeat-containing protein [Ornithinibacillus sp. 16A2E]|uniref:Pentapeptide repeat-containing protein n=1 Tax=Ornithinibacillus xuwenensis TaxID=3144668 RepID=A0ABU9XGL7_9BACI
MINNRDEKNQNKFQADCTNCYGLCCIALPFAKSSDFSFDKDGGTPCPKLQSDYRCSIHQLLRERGHKGCAVYECFGAGQKVSQVTYNGKSWRESPNQSEEMFRVFPIMQQLHEILYYLHEARKISAAKSIHEQLDQVIEHTERLTLLATKEILKINVHAHRANINPLLLEASRLVRMNVAKPNNQNLRKKTGSRMDLIGVKLSGENLRGSDMRGALLIAADLRGSDLRETNFIGADLRDADLSGANLSGSIFLTQAQVNAAKGNHTTKLPNGLHIPSHWDRVG